jgi:Fic family protein
MDILKISEFKSGELVKQYEYHSFSPAFINRQWVVDDPGLQELVSEASRYLGELNVYSQLVPDVDFFIKMHVSKEATASSRIEGTQTNIEDAFLKVEDISPEKRNDWHEVQNYIQAMNDSINSLDTLPVSNRLICAAHKTLLQGVRGEHKCPGEFRKSQNWIGGASLKDAAFIPPYYSEVPELMSDLEKFLHNDTIRLSEVIRIGIAHYQFETIHPFCDGNGRIGRLLIGLDLVSKRLLFKPALYLSDFFEKNKDLYYDNLSRVRSHHDLNQWLKFFIVGIIESSQNSIQTFKKILILKIKLDADLMTLGKRANLAKRWIDILYTNPICQPSDVQEKLGVSAPTANQLIKEIEKLGYLKEETGFKRNRIFSFKPYLDIFH